MFDVVKCGFMKDTDSRCQNVVSRAIQNILSELQCCHPFRFMLDGGMIPQSVER